MPFSLLAWNQSGDLWDPLVFPPDPGASVAATGQLILTNSSFDHFAMVFCGRFELLQIGSDGSLWHKPSSFPASGGGSDGPWRRLGKRSDWVSLWSLYGTAYGLTADGTLWTWGTDPTRRAALGLAGSLRVLQQRVQNAFAAPAFRMGARVAPVPNVQKDPRPLLQLVQPSQ